MPAEDFVHLHVHSEYSLLDGAIRCGALAKRVREMGMDAVARRESALTAYALERLTELPGLAIHGPLRDRGGAGGSVRGGRGGGGVVLRAHGEAGVSVSEGYQYT